MTSFISGSMHTPANSQNLNRNTKWIGCVRRRQGVCFIESVRGQKTNSFFKLAQNVIAMANTTVLDEFLNHIECDEYLAMSKVA